MIELGNKVLCECGCKGISKPGNRFIHGHGGRGKQGWSKGLTKETDKRVANNSRVNLGKLRIPRETRTCECGCGNLFICKITSKQKFIRYHNRRGICASQETLKKQLDSLFSRKKEISKTQKKLWEDPIYRDSQIKAIMSGSNKKPNECEKLLFKIVDSLFPGSWLLNTKGEHIRPAGKCPDIVNIKEKKCIEHRGDYWHANPEFCKRTGTKFVSGISVEDIRQRDKKRIDLIEKKGWKILIIWEHELKDMEKLKDKILEFCRVEELWL